MEEKKGRRRKGGGGGEEKEVEEEMMNYYCEDTLTGSVAVKVFAFISNKTQTLV
jgi:hypothetical protein